MIKKIYTFLPYFLILLAIAIRFMPHLPNATPITAIALFGGVYLNRRLSIILPLTAMFLSDLLIGFYTLPIMLSVYGSFAIIGLSGWWLAKHKSFFNTMGTTVAGSTLFFLVTNWAVWQFGAWYPHTSSGLWASYIAGLPFWRNMLVGDLFYVGILFGVYETVLYYARRQALASKPR